MAAGAPSGAAAAAGGSSSNLVADPAALSTPHERVAQLERDGVRGWPRSAPRHVVVRGVTAVPVAAGGAEDASATTATETRFRVVVAARTSPSVRCSFEVAIPSVDSAAVGARARVRCAGSTDALNERGRKLVDPVTGAVRLPSLAAAAAGAVSRAGGWLPHYDVAVLVFLLAQLCREEAARHELEAVSSLARSPAWGLSARLARAEDRGRRAVMEDRTALLHSEEGSCSALGVCGCFLFDGHGGASAAHVASELVPAKFMDALRAERLGAEDCVQDGGVSVSVDGDGGGDHDDDRRALAIRHALRVAVRSAESALRASGEASGTTATCAVVDEVCGVLHCANVGDSRAVLCRNGAAMDVSVDHRASNPAEAARVVEAGGFVAKSRTMGVLAVSRALGDGDLKRGDSAIVAHEPDVESVRLDPTRDEFCVCACDGVFDVLSSQAAVSVVRGALLEGVSEAEACAALVARAVHEGSLDNVSVALVRLSWSLKPSRVRSAVARRIAERFGGGADAASSSVAFASAASASARAPAVVDFKDTATFRAAQASAIKRQGSREHAPLLPPAVAALTSPRAAGTSSPLLRPAPSPNGVGLHLAPPPLALSELLSPGAHRGPAGLGAPAGAPARDDADGDDAQSTRIL